VASVEGVKEQAVRERRRLGHVRDGVTETRSRRRGLVGVSKQARNGTGDTYVVRVAPEVVAEVGIRGGEGEEGHDES
jgi:hypothetical protein